MADNRKTDARETLARRSAASKRGAATRARLKAMRALATVEVNPGARCRVCGCTDDHACVTTAGACYWVEPDLCSACAGKPAAAAGAGGAAGGLRKRKAA